MSNSIINDATDAGMEPLLDERATAALLYQSVSYLQKARLRSDGPPFVKMGKSVRYRPAAIRAYIAANEVRSTSERAA